jgi:hypothetical protein
LVEVAPTPNKPIYIDQGNGTFKKYVGSVEALQIEGWPAFAPAGTLPQGATTPTVAFDHVYSRQGFRADLMTFKPPTEKDWANFAQFLRAKGVD